MKDIDFNKVRKPEFIKHHSFEPNLRIDGNLYTIERKISALAIKEEEKIIVERIVEIAKEHTYDILPKYCCECGAKMDGKED